VAAALLIAVALAPSPIVAQADDIEALNQRAIELHRAAKYAEAIPLAERYVEAMKARHGPDDPKYATALNNLAQLLVATNRLAEAEPLMRRVISIFENSLGAEHPNVATSLNNLAVLLEEGFGRYDESEKLKRRALAIDEKSVGPDHPNVAIRLNNLAVLLWATNRLAEAEPLMRRALAIDEKSVGPDHPNVATGLNNLAALLQDTNRLGEAEPLMRRALAIDEASFGPEHPNVAIRLNNLAGLLQATNRLAEAEPLMRRALAIDEKSLGPEHPNVAIRLNNLAQLLKATNRLGEAEPLMRRALAIDEKSFGPEHPNVAIRLNNLALLLQATDRLADAEPLMRRALAIDEKSFGPDHPNVARVLNNLALLLQATNRLAEAEPLMRRALEVAERAHAPDHPTVALMNENLGGFYKAQTRHSEAQPLLEKALAIKEKTFGPNDPRLAYTLTQVGDLYRLQGQCARADPLFVRARAVGAATIQEVPVLFGTDRKRDDKQPSVTFGSERGGLSFGLVIVTVPTGQAERAPAAKAGAGTEVTQTQRLAMNCIEVVGDKEIVDAATRRIGAAKAHARQALVFVHGYNVSFDNALRRAAQIAHDIKFDGGVFLFSWPSRGRVMDYFSDRETVDLATLHLRQFLDRIVAETAVAKVHFIAHSMGSMVLLRALERIAGDGASARLAIGEVVTASPDIDPDLFAEMTGAIRARGGSFTLYASRGDWALRISGLFRDRARAGFIKDKPLIVPGVDTIDITAAGTDLFAWNHDIYSSSPLLVADMRRIIGHSERPPDKRTKAFERVEAKEGTYWRLRRPQQAAQ
jgi:esterase/lipase superfamily enzyme/Tfp pilus assembly protein PilF